MIWFHWSTVFVARFVLVITWFWGWFGKNQPRLSKKFLKSPERSEGDFKNFLDNQGWFFQNHPKKTCDYWLITCPHLIYWDPLFMIFFLFFDFWFHTVFRQNTIFPLIFPLQFRNLTSNSVPSPKLFDQPTYNFRRQIRIGKRKGSKLGWSEGRGGWRGWG